MDRRTPLLVVLALAACAGRSPLATAPHVATAGPCPQYDRGRHGPIGVCDDEADAPALVAAPAASDGVLAGASLAGDGDDRKSQPLGSTAR